MKIYYYNPCHAQQPKHQEKGGCRKKADQQKRTLLVKELNDGQTDRLLPSATWDWASTRS
jgi:hypothetical protein